MVWQEDQTVDEGSDKGQGCEKSEVPQQVGGGEKQAQEGSYRGQAADSQREGQFPDRVLVESTCI